MDNVCPHCGLELISDREKYIKCCFRCRRYALLRGTWPEQQPLYEPEQDNSNQE